MGRKERIRELKKTLDGLRNDARYWDLVRTYGESSPEVERHLRSCQRAQRSGLNCT